MPESNIKIPIAVICGPTATGKTGAAIEVCGVLGGEVVSADSMQVYKGLRIGTARPDERELRGIPHHLMGEIEPDRNFSVSDWCDMARPVIQKIYERGKLPVIVGGTGLYINSLIDGIEFDDTSANKELRGELSKLAEEMGTGYIYSILEKEDPGAALKIHRNDQKRIIRAIELRRGSGLEYDQRIKWSKSKESAYLPVMMGLNYVSRQELYIRINNRVDEMVARGLREEVEGLLRSGISPGCTALQAIGYKEMIDAIHGECTQEEAVEEIKRSSRRYAKRQLTWFRRDKRIRWFDAGDERVHEQMACYLSGCLRGIYKTEGHVE